MMDFGAQPIVIGKLFAKNLTLTTKNLKLYPFTIITLLEGTKDAIGYI